MEITLSTRLQKLPPYLFAEIDELKDKLLREGKDVIDLSVGDPDFPTPDFIINKLCESVQDPKNHKYPFGKGLFQFRNAVMKWYKNRFGVVLDPEEEVTALIGSKEGIAHIPLGFVNEGDVVLIPDPCYPVYPAATTFACGIPYFMPLTVENNFLPDLDSIPKDVLEKAKLMFINYPNNPTGACATLEFFQKVVELAKEYNIIVCHDAAYTEITFEGYSPPSFLETPGAMEVGIEFHSLSKTFNMTGWRIGFAVGNKEIIKGLVKVKSNIDSGIFRAVQSAATVALEKGPIHLEEQLKVLQERRDIVINALKQVGWKVIPPKATFYIWASVPPGRTSKELAMWFLKEIQVIVTPGNGFGKYGEGYIRFSLTAPTSRIKEAMERLLSIRH